MDPVASGAVVAPASAAAPGLPEGSDSQAPAASGMAVGDTSSAAPTIKRRAPIACRRCRRMRSKCIHNNAVPPCKSCREAGISAADCIFPVRGAPDTDREYRHPRARAAKAAKQESTASSSGPAPRSLTRGSSTDLWEGLPPGTELFEGASRFTTHYFQIGFLPKQHFLGALRVNPRSVNLFLLLSILSISARMSPALSQRYGGGLEASGFFTDRASDIAALEVYQTPTLERCQAFFLLSIALQGAGDTNRGSINMAISVRMATLMQLHREETFQIDNPSPEVVIRAESARRTLLMLHCQDSLHSGPLCPVSLAAADITTLLPCEEEDFEAGRLPASRAAMPDTSPALQNPSLVHDPGRSLFASLVQIHYFWGIVSRRATSFSHGASPWEPTSKFSTMAKRLQDWEQGLPRDHLWDPGLLQAYKAKGEEMAYLSVVMMCRLCNIVLRRPFLANIISFDTSAQARQPFFSSLSLALFRNVRTLFEQIDAQFADHSPNDSVGTQISSFCIYSCGLFSTYLCKYPNICPDPAITSLGPVMLQRTISILMECRKVWPLASRWAELLEGYFHDPQLATLGGNDSMAPGKDPIPQALNPQADTMLHFPGSSTFASSMPSAEVLSQTPSSALSSAQSTPTNSRPGAFSDISSIPVYQQTIRHLSAPPAQAESHPPHGLAASQGQYTSDPRQMYEAPPQSIPHADELGILTGPFDPSGQQQQQQQQPLHDPQAPVTAQYQPIPGVHQPPLPQQLGPATDGFEGELQFYVEGSAPWPQGGPSSWTGGY